MKLKLKLLQLFLHVRLSVKSLPGSLHRHLACRTDGYALYGGLTWNDLLPNGKTLGSQNLRLIDISNLFRKWYTFIQTVCGVPDRWLCIYGGVDWNTFVPKWQTWQNKT